MLSGQRRLRMSAIAAGAILAAGGSVALAFTSDHVAEPALQAALFNWITLSYVFSGLVAWWRRPAGRFGPLMILAGFAASLSNLAWANAPLPYTVGQAFDLLPLVLFLHVYLAFPSGRLEDRSSRIIVAAGYAAAVGGQLLAMMLGDFGPDNLLSVAEMPAVANVIHGVELVGISVAALAGVGVLLTRRRTGGPPRRSAALLVDSFALALVMIAVLLIMGLYAGPWFVAVQRITLVVLGVAPIAFLVGLLDARLARTGVGDLMVELRGGPADLRAPIARALRDPSLSLLYWLPQFASWTDPDGRPVELPTSGGRRAVTVIDRAGQHVAALIHDAALNDEPELLDAVSAAAGMALENGRLRAELHASLDEVRQSRARVIDAGQRERQRLERDLHDGAQQRLIALSLDLSLLEGRLAGEPDAKDALAQAKREIAASLEELRDVARGLHPAVLTGHGLEVALESLVARAPVAVRLSVRLDGRPPEPVEVAAYYVVSESLANIGKHARATSVTVDVVRTDDTIVVEVVDDGVGGADPERGTGLRGLADRVEALGGRLRVWTPPGDGTRVRAEMPCG